MKTRTILISGGGVAGRALAIWLVQHGETSTWSVTAKARLDGRER